MPHDALGEVLPVSQVRSGRCGGREQIEDLPRRGADAADHVVQRLRGAPRPRRDQSGAPFAPHRPASTAAGAPAARAVATHAEQPPPKDELPRT